jgi:hypothetical protein
LEQWRLVTRNDSAGRPVRQLEAAQFKGAVKDSSDAAIGGAAVLIHWDSAGSAVGLKSKVGIKADLSIRTRHDGTFSVDLPPGFYDVFAAAQGLGQNGPRMTVGHIEVSRKRLAGFCHRHVTCAWRAWNASYLPFSVAAGSTCAPPTNPAKLDTFRPSST